MARREAIFKMKLDSDDAVQDVKKLDKDFTSLRDTIEVDVSGSISAMEDRLYELAAAGKTNTKEFKQLQKQTADYKKVVIETDRSIDALAEQGRGLNTALSLAEGTVAGFQAFTGVSALLGDENEELLETITKLQAAQGVLNSISLIKQQIQNNGIALTRLQTTAQLALNFAVGKGSKAMKIFRVALISTGIGAIVVGLGLLIANFDKVRDAVQNAVKRFKNMGEGVKTVISILLPFIGVIRLIGAGLEALGIIESDQDREREKQHKAQVARYKKESEEIDKKLSKMRDEHKEFEDNGNFQIRMMKAQGASKEEIIKAEQNLRKEIIKNNKARIEQIRLDQLIDVAERDRLHARGEIEAGNKISDKIKESNKLYHALVAANKNLNQEIKVEDAKFKTEQEKAEEKHQENLTKTIKEAYEERKAEVEKYKEVLKGVYTNDLTDGQKAFNDRLKLFDEQMEAINILYDKGAIDKEKFEQAKLDIEQKFIDKSAALAEEAWQESKEADKKREEALFAEIDGIEDENLAKEEARRDKERKANKKAAKEEIELAKATEEAKNNIRSKSFDLALNLTELFTSKNEESQKRAFKITKGINIAQTIQTGIQGVVNALSAKSVLPEPLASIQKGVNAATIASTTALSVKKIQASTFNGGGGSVGGLSRGGGGSIQGASAGSFSIDQNQGSSSTDLNQDGSQANTGNGMATKVFVTEQDITNTQNKVKATEAISTF